MTGSPRATLEIHGTPIGSEPLGNTATVIVDAAGFHDTEGLGRGGDPAGVLSAADVAARLKQQLNPEELRVLLAHLVKLHEALAP